MNTPKPDKASRRRTAVIASLALAGSLLAVPYIAQAASVAPLAALSRLRTRTRAFAALPALAGLIGALLVLPATTAHADTPEHHSTASYNSQGARWSDVRAISNDNDIVAVQEAGSNPRQFGMTLLSSSSHNGYTVYLFQWGSRYVYWMDTDPTGHRVTLATVTHTMAHEIFVAPPGRASSRPALGLRFDDDIYYNVHAAASGASNEAPELLGNIARQATAAGRSWTAMGDFNRDPNEGMFTAAAGLHGFVYHSGTATQQSGGELDYMVSSRSMGNFRGMRAAGRSSDHYPIYYRTRIVGAGSVVDLVDDAHPGTFLRFERLSSANGTRVVADAYEAKGSLWTMRHAAGGGQWDFNIVNNATGKCIDVEGGPRASDGSPLSESDCQGTYSQVFDLAWWTEEPGAWMLLHKGTNLCVDNAGILMLHPCHAKTPSERFLPHFH